MLEKVFYFIKYCKRMKTVTKYNLYNSVQMLVNNFTLMIITNKRAIVSDFKVLI